MGTTAAIAFCVLIAGLGLFQIALAAGAPLGRFAWGGGHERLPANLRAGSAVSVAIYAVIVIIVLERAGLASVLPYPQIAAIGIWVIVAWLALGVVMNAISRSRPERYTMTPVALVLCLLALGVALGAAP